MKNLLGLGLVLFVCGSCAHYYTFKPVGDLSMAATRNIDNSKEYVALKNYAGISRDDVAAAMATAKKGKIKKKNPIIKEINAFKASDIKDAIDKVVKSVAGGDYLYNLKIYHITEVSGFMGKKVDYSFVLSGDVWGVNSADNNIKGFHKGDKVVFVYSRDLKKEIGTKNFTGEVGKQYKGTVIGLKSGLATVLLDNESVVDIPYSYLTNLGQ
ncbi:MAG TPA: hypothetical protein PLP27_00190 [Crocinitomicaceae bacterium]|nr:hypothetical protein [Crocinitomicaceae bacterium]